MVNTCNSSVSVLVKFIAVLFRALQKLGVLAAKIFELIDEIYSHLCFMSGSCLVMGTHMHETGAHKQTTHSARTQQ